VAYSPAARSIASRAGEAEARTKGRGVGRSWGISVDKRVLFLTAR
jgi:hypothetical protein